MSAPTLKTTDFWKAVLEKMTYYYGGLLVACFGAAIVFAIGKSLSPRESFIVALIENFPTVVVLCVLVFVSFSKIRLGSLWFSGGVFVLILTMFFEWNHPLSPYAMIRVTDDGFLVSGTIARKDSEIVTEVRNDGQRFAEEALADFWGDGYRGEGKVEAYVDRYLYSYRFLWLFDRRTEVEGYQYRTRSESLSAVRGPFEQYFFLGINLVPVIAWLAIREVRRQKDSPPPTPPTRLLTLDIPPIFERWQDSQAHSPGLTRLHLITLALATLIGSVPLWAP